MSSTEPKHAAVIGAGLTGLTVAYRLQQAGWRVSVFESSEQAGGRVQTIARDGYLIDTGASALANSYKSYLALAEELGLKSEIVATAPSVGIYRDGRVHELRMDQLLRAGLHTKVLSWSAKLKLLRLAWDIALAKLRGQLDYADIRRAAPLDTESASDYACRVLNKEIDDYLGSPIIRTMLIADADKVSKVELLSGVANIFSARILVSRGGQARLPGLLAECVMPRVQHMVLQVCKQGDSVMVDYRDPQGSQHTQHFDACVVCCPLPEAVQICLDQHALLEPLHTGLTYTQSITVAFALSRPPRSSAFLVQMPACEDAEIALLFLDHNKASDRAPSGCGLIGCHWETGAATRMMERPDDEIVARSLATVLRVFPELQGQVVFSHVTRWRHALPFTAVGAYRRIGEFNAALDSCSRIQFASDYMSAAGQNTAVELGNRAAQRLCSIQ
jgi:protoporphyrinogen/coproporphyrinogen III oxidase